MASSNAGGGAAAPKGGLALSEPTMTTPQLPNSTLMSAPLAEFLNILLCILWLPRMDGATANG